MSNVLRKTSPDESKPDHMNEIAARIEFLAVLETALREEQILTIYDLQNTFEQVFAANEVSHVTCNRKALKTLLQNEIADIEFHKPKRRNEPERVSVKKKKRDEAIRLSEDMLAKCNKELKILFDAAAILRKGINRSKRWEFSGTLTEVGDEVISEELFLFARWLIQGTKQVRLNKEKRDDAKKRSLSLCHSAMSMCLTDRQCNNKKSKTLSLSREMPQQLVVGLAVHQATRSKDLVNMLHGFGMAVEYNRVMRVEAQIEATVLERMEENGGVYIPPDIVKGRQVYFAVDNVDFAEDTYDGQRTLHGTVMAVYQRKELQDATQELR